MRVHDHVRDNSFNCEWQVFLAIRHTACTLLSMSGSELITDLGHLDSSHLNLDQAAHLLVRSQDDLVDVALLRVLERS